MKLKKAAVLVCAAVLSLTTLSQAGAATQTDELQQQIDEVLANTTGSVQISRNEIAWNDGEAIMSFPLPGEEVAPPSSDAAVQLQAKMAGVSSKSVAADAAAGKALAADDNCPTETFGNDWYCFYQFENYGGRRLQWNESHHHPDLIFFESFNFANMTSSWSNKGGKYIYVEGRSVSGSDGSCYRDALHLWQEAPHSKKAYVGASLDNRADCFWTS